MGHSPESRVDIADVLALGHHLVEPRLLGVVEPPEVERADVGQMIALVVDDPQVDQAQHFAAHVQGGEHGGQHLLPAQLFETVGFHQHGQQRGPFAQEHFGGLTLGGGQNFDLIDDAGLVRPGKLVVDGQAKQYQRRDRHEERQ